MSPQIERVQVGNHGAGKLESLHPAEKVGARVTSTTRDQNQYHGKQCFEASDSSSVMHEGNHSSHRGGEPGGRRALIYTQQHQMGTT